MNDTNIDTMIRPRTIADMYKTKVEAMVSKIISSGSINHSFLLTGETGCGKTTMARAIATYLFTNGTLESVDLDKIPEYIEVNAGRYSKVAEMRELLSDIETPPLMNKHMVVVFDEAHRLTKEAQSALLKDIEEPPDHLYIFMCTNHPDKLVEELKGRCQHLVFNRPTPRDLDDFATKYAVSRILKSLGFDATAEHQKNAETITSDGAIMKRIIECSKQTYRGMVKKLHEYILTGEVTALDDTTEESLSKLHQLIIYTEKETWKDTLKNTISKMKEFEETRRALCNYIAVVYINNLTKADIHVRIKYMNAINILKDELAYTCQKADLAERLSRIILANAGIISIHGAIKI